MNDFKKGGRPEKENKREKSKILYFTNSEFEELNSMFKDSIYQNMNEMMRDILLKKQFKVLTLDNELKEERNKIIEECRRIGNNFNQLIKLFNQKKLNYFTENDVQRIHSNVEMIKDLYLLIEKNVKK